MKKEQQKWSNIDSSVFETLDSLFKPKCPYLKINDVSMFLDQKPDTVRKLYYDGLITAGRTSGEKGSLLFTREDILNYLQTTRLTI